MTDLEERLTELGTNLAGDDLDLVDDVLAVIVTPERGRTRRRWLAAAAVVLLVVAAVAVAVPSARRTVARWFGFDQASIERQDDLVVPDRPDPIAPTGPDTPEIGESDVVEIDEQTVLVSTIDGRLDPGLLAKTVGSGTDVVEIDVGGELGLWIGGAPHEVVYMTPGGSPVVERIAGNTLLWQVGPVLYRLEGFDDVDDALGYAATVGTD